MPVNYPTETLSLKKTNHYFWLFILLHTLIWTLGPFLLRPTIPHDTLEGITWGLQWQLGYNKHPFLAAWLCAGITQLFGTTGWPVYLLAQLAVSTTFFAVWKLAKHILPHTHALIATLALEGVLFYNINSFNFTPDTLQSPLWALLSLFFYQALTRQTIGNWLGVGLFAALCVCTKYQAALLFLPMFLFCLFNPIARISFAKSGIYFSLLVFFLLITPHLIWLYHHDFITLTYAAEISSDYTQKKTLLNHLTHPLGFFINSVIDVTGLFILLWPFYKTSIFSQEKHKSKIRINSFKWQFLIFIGLGPLILSFLLCLLTGDYFPPRWSTPYFFAIGILTLAYLKPALSERNLKQFAITLVLFSLLLFTTKMSTLTLFPRAASDAFLPNQKIAQSLSELWQKHSPTPLPFLAGSHYLVTGIVPYMVDKPIPYLSWESVDSPWVNEKELHQQGGLFIWDEGGYYTWDKQSLNHTHIPESVLKRFPKLKIISDLTINRLSDNQPIVIGVAILLPEQ